MSYTLSHQVEQRGGVVILRLEGYLNDQTERDFEGVFQEATSPCKRLVLDATALDHISSIGFGTMLALAAELREAGGDLRLLGLRPSMLRALTLAFGSYFQVFEVEREAIDSFGPVAV